MNLKIRQIVHKELSMITSLGIAAKTFSTRLHIRLYTSRRQFSFESVYSFCRMSKDLWFEDLQYCKNNAVKLSGLAFPNQKVIVVNDPMGVEWISFRWCKELLGDDVGECVVNTLEETSPYLVMSIAKLERRFQLSEIFKFVRRCRQNSQVVHLCIWVSPKTLENAFLLPYLEYMADTVITFEDEEHLTLTMRKPTGKIMTKYYTFEATHNIFITEAKRTVRKSTEAIIVDASLPPNLGALGTFKIDLKYEEIKAKNAITLPFEFYKSTPEGGKILYHPDAQDDLDEEDPDDDLLI